jgi:glycosyltransferase involved in cell wall biosynthesis
MPKRVILHHATLPHRGGAVRVARLLMAAQAAAGLSPRASFEVPENAPEDAPDADPGSQISPQLLGQAWAALPPDSFLHLHTSSHWPDLLSGVLPHAPGRRLLLTLHDATPLTGGCAYPMNCPLFPACADPCPRDFAQARSRQAELLGLLKALAPALVAPSAWLAGLAKTLLPGLSVRVIPNGIPWPPRQTLPSRAQARAALGIAPRARVALFAAHGGHRAAYKSGPRWPEYWEAASSGIPDALAYAVGGDEFASLAPGGNLSVWPYVDRSRLTLLMRAADCLLYPTLADNHPLVLLEAAALELPVVSFRVGGVPEIVAHGETGLLASPPGEIGRAHV